MPEATTHTERLNRWDGHLVVLQATVARHANGPVAPEATHQARRWLVDTVGCTLAGRQAEEVQRFEAAMAALEPGHFRFPGGAPLSVWSAAQVIAMAATWDEACEGHALAHGRPGVPLIAALLPLALQRGTTLAQFTDALVLGYEVGARTGAWLRIRPGMHVDANWPSLGVAAGVAKLLGLDAAGIMQAVNIAGCQLATSLYLPVASGRTARNTYLAHSALLGLQSAFASLAGIDAPADVLAHYASQHAAAAPDPLPGADVTLLLQAYLKPFAAVRHVHYGAVAAQRLRRQLPGGTHTVRRITLTVYEEATVYCGNRAPQTPIQAQFSLSFGLAAVLCFGDIDPPVYAEPRFHDAELRRLEALVELRIDPDLTARRQRGATLVVEHTTGLLTDTVHAIPGDATNPLDRTELCAKFTRYAARSVSTAHATHFCNAVLDAPLDSTTTDLRSLWQQIASHPLTPPGTP